MQPNGEPVSVVADAGYPVLSLLEGRIWPVVYTLAGETVYACLPLVQSSEGALDPASDLSRQ